jgi:hypothetical protein
MMPGYITSPNGAITSVPVGHRPEPLDAGGHALSRCRRQPTRSVGRREGKARLASRLGQTAALLRPLIDALEQHVLCGERLHADDTTVPVLAPGLGRTKTGRIWTYVRNDRASGGTAAAGVFYRYTPDRKGEHPRAHLTGFAGILQADGYAGFAQLYHGNRISEAACLAHAWRKFFDLFEATKSPVAKTAMEKIAALYGMEAEIPGQPPNDRLRIRREQSAPLFANLKAWLETTLRRVPGRSDMAKAIRYALSRWQALTMILRDGRAFVHEAAPALTRFANSSPMPFVNGIKAAREKNVARTDDDRSEFLRKRGFSKTETAKIIETVLTEEGRKPESVFDFVQGITAIARDKTHQDARLRRNLY